MKKLFILLLIFLLIAVLVFFKLQEKEVIQANNGTLSSESLESSSLNLEEFYIPKINKFNESASSDSPQGASVASVYYVEATVLSLEQDSLEEKEHCEHASAIGAIAQICPRDRILIRIDYFEGHEQAKNFVNSNPEQFASLQYSSRPAQLIADEKPGCEGEGCPQSITINYNGVCTDEKGKVIDCSMNDLKNKKTEFKDGFIIYHFAEDYFKYSLNIEENKIYLHGIKVGDKIKFTTFNLCWQDQDYCWERDSKIEGIIFYEVI